MIALNGVSNALRHFAVLAYHKIPCSDTFGLTFNESMYFGGKVSYEWNWEELLLWETHHYKEIHICTEANHLYLSNGTISRNMKLSQLPQDFARCE